MATILEQATLLFTWCMTQLGALVTQISSTPILMLGFLVSLVGLIVGLTKRLINIK